MMTDEIWDIRDKRPVELPNDDGFDAFEIMEMPQLSRDIALDRYERAVMMMEPLARARYLRFNATSDVLMTIVMHGVKLGLTTYAVRGTNQPAFKPK